ncbi:phosphoglucomutase/phosphomannomutase family protein [Natronomonas salsuginis]|uniref:Phosphoglucomutase/phosphomannomutase family protein n=1 Tax=Natronomonas salsuginis TaxID=2217661 RepID=A0A4U5JAK2_9EURY|nr:phosphoglucomutase/phosphomannomutase family protein [Natronomonas salsuginis]TKR25575.1 phosphoglucomutase/phosphomannomutase family protein [Natronomonas salsuginis]
MDIEFGTDGWRTTVDEFTAPRIRAVGQAVADHLRETGEDAPVAIGYDPREGSRPAAEELARVLCANGFDALVPERDTPTPVVAWTVTDRDLSGALQVTASHNPATYNGIKFVPSDGAPALPDVTDRLVAELKPPEPIDEERWGSVREIDMIGPYLDHAVSFVGTDLDGMAVAHDAMHGSGRGVTDELLSRAGATVTRRRNEADPEFGGSPPEPSAERLAELEAEVRSGDAELGIANDGDSDRIAVVTPERGVVDPNWVFAALYDHLLESAGGDAVRTVSTTAILDRIAEAHGRAVHETAVGFKWVAEAMADHGALVGGEESGGFGITAHLRNKDGVLIALVVAAAHGEEPLDDRLDRLRAEYGDIVQDRRSIDCPDDRKAAVLDRLGEELPETVAGSAIDRVGRTDGFKLFLSDGSWVLVRPSGTEPKLRVYAEAGSDERVDELLSAGMALLEPLV